MDNPRLGSRHVVQDSSVVWNHLLGKVLLFDIKIISRQRAFLMGLQY